MENLNLFQVSDSKVLELKARHCCIFKSSGMVVSMFATMAGFFKLKLVSYIYSGMQIAAGECGPF